jgi:hypothetical protein
MIRFFWICVGWLAFIGLAAAGIAFIPLGLAFIGVFLVIAVTGKK